MDIKALGAKAAASVKRDDSSKVSLKAAAQTDGSQKPADAAAESFFENSGKLGQVRALIDDLVQLPEFDAAAVTRGRELLESGAIDSPEAIDRAVDGFFEEASGL